MASSRVARQEQVPRPRKISNALARAETQKWRTRGGKEGWMQEIVEFKARVLSIRRASDGQQQSTRELNGVVGNIKLQSDAKKDDFRDVGGVLQYDLLISTPCYFRQIIKGTKLRATKCRSHESLKAHAHRGIVISPRNFIWRRHLVAGDVAETAFVAQPEPYSA